MAAGGPETAGTEARETDHWRIVLVARGVDLEDAAECSLDAPSMRFCGSVTAASGGTTSPRSPDLIVLDCAGLVGGVLDLLVATHRRWPDAVALLVGGPDDSHWLAGAAALGVRGALPRGADVAQIAAAADAIRRGELWFSRRTTRQVLAAMLGAQRALLREHLEHAPDLTDREREVARRAIDGLSRQAIALELQITPRAVGDHLVNIYRKLRIHRRPELLLRIAAAHRTDGE